MPGPLSSTSSRKRPFSGFALTLTRHVCGSPMVAEVGHAGDPLFRDEFGIAPRTATGDPHAGPLNDRTRWHASTSRFQIDLALSF